MTGCHIELKEWESRSPDKGSDLEGLHLPFDAPVAELVESLNKTGKIEILQLRSGLHLKAFSYVGTIKLGNVAITIHPKISGQPLMSLIRYAYGIRNLALYSPFESGVESQAFQDLLVYQLFMEAKELLARGIRREYLRQNDDLNTIRGKIDFKTLACRGGAGRASVPCNFYPRLEDCVFNRLMKSGLRFAAFLAEDMELRIGIRRTVSLLYESVSDEKLTYSLIDRAQRSMNRLTRPYRSIFKIIELLMDSAGMSLTSEHNVKLPGFLFDMNRFFQTLVSRFLNENLRGYSVIDEYRLKEMMRYAQSHNPLNKKAPTPRPDCAIMKNGDVVSLLDAKYRDLWENSLPREMLYQLGMYAMSQKERRVSTILYPAADRLAREARIEIREPIYGSANAMVVLRPVNLLAIQELVSGTETARKERQRSSLASSMAFGEG